jgi:hypothetical protein
MTARHIRVRESVSGLDCRFQLLDDVAPQNAEALWVISGAPHARDAIHAMWTGPEISCPISDPDLPSSLTGSAFTAENATSFPEEGEIAVVYAPANSWKGQGGSGFFDIGLFYGRGARLLMPMGWIMASVCARVDPADLQALRDGCQKIRRRGACSLTFLRDI